MPAVSSRPPFLVSALSLRFCSPLARIFSPPLFPCRLAPVACIRASPFSIPSPGAFAMPAFFLSSFCPPYACHAAFSRSLFSYFLARPFLSNIFLCLPFCFFISLFRPSLLFYLSYAFAPSVRFNHRRAAPFFCPFSSHIRPISSVFCLVPFLFNPPGRLSPRFPVVFSPAAFAAFSFVLLFFLRLLFARAAPIFPFCLLLKLFSSILDFFLDCNPPSGLC